MTKHLTRGALFAATLLMVAGCKEDLTQETASFDALSKEWSGKLDGLKKAHADLVAKADAVELPAGNDALAGVKTALVGSLKSAGTGLDGVQKAMDAAKASVDAAVKLGKKAPVQAAIDAAKTAVGGSITAAGEMITKNTTGLADLVKQVTDAKAAAAAANFAKALPGGFSLSGSVNGIEAGLVGFIEDAGKAVDKDTWFDFDRLLFKSGSADLDMDKSKEQLVNVAEIMKAYANVKLKVGGYTDNEGKADANKKLSQQRADSVVKALVGMGVKADRMDAEGYGAEHPVCPANDTPECKEKNRRISVRVTAK